MIEMYLNQISECIKLEPSPAKIKCKSSSRIDGSILNKYLKFRIQMFQTNILSFYQKNNITCITQTSFSAHLFYSSGQKFLHSYTATNRNPILHDWENLAALLLESVIFPCNVQLHYCNYLILKDPRINCLVIYFSLPYYGDQAMALPHLNWRMLEFYQIDPNVNCPQNWHFRLIDVNQHSGGKCIKHSVNKPWTNFASDFVPRVQPD